MVLFSTTQSVEQKYPQQLNQIKSTAAGQKTSICMGFCVQYPFKLFCLLGQRQTKTTKKTPQAKSTRPQLSGFSGGKKKEGRAINHAGFPIQLIDVRV